MLTSPRMQSARRKKLSEWVRVKLDQTPNRLQLLRLHVNGSQMRKVSKRWDSQPLSTNWICMWNRQRRRWIISLVVRKKDLECSETLHCSCNEAKRSFKMNTVKRGSALKWPESENQYLTDHPKKMKSMQCSRHKGFQKLQARLSDSVFITTASGFISDMQSWRCISLFHTGWYLPDDQTPAAIKPSATLIW